MKLLAKKKAGVKLGRPRGTGKSKLDHYRPEIKAFLANGSTQKFIAQRYNTTEANLSRWLKNITSAEPKGKSLNLFGSFTYIYARKWEIPLPARSGVVWGRLRSTDWNHVITIARLIQAGYFFILLTSFMFGLRELKGGDSVTLTVDI